MEYVDNYNETIKAIKQYIFDNVPREFMTDWEIERLNTMMNKDHCNYLNINFKNEHEQGSNFSAEASLYVDITYDFKLQEGCDGNLWEKYKVVVMVNYPSYGSSPPDICRERVGIIMSTINLAESIKGKFLQPFYRISRTKAEIDEDKQKVKASKEFKLIEDFIKYLPERKNMRVAKMKYIIIPSGVSFSPGQYNIKIDEKEYNLTVRKDIDDDSYMPADLMRIK